MSASTLNLTATIRKPKLQPVQRTVLVTEMFHQRLIGERFTGDDLHQAVRAILLSALMNLFVEPRFQRPKLSLREL